MPISFSKHIRVLSKCWIGILVAIFLIVWGIYFSVLILVVLGVFCIYSSFRYGKGVIKSIEEEKNWNNEYEGRLFLVYAAKKELQLFIQRHIVPEEAPSLIHIFYSGPKIVTQYGPINKYYLRGIYRNSGTVRLFKLENGKFVEIEYFGPAENIQDSAELVKQRIQKIYDSNI